MRAFLFRTAMIVGGLLSAVTVAAQPSDAIPVLDRLRAEDNATVTKTPDGIRFTNNREGVEARLYTGARYAVPLIITARAKTDSNNIRLYYGGKGMLALNWEVNNSELRHNDPKTGEQVGVANQGAVPKNTWVVVRWVIEKDRCRVDVNGVQRATIRGNFDKMSEPVGIGTYKGIVTFESVSVTPIRGAPQPPPVEQRGEAGPVRVKVPSAPLAPDAPKEEPVGPEFLAIERSAFQDRPKRLVKQVTAVNAMMVRIGEDGQATGLTSDIIATVPRQSPSADGAAVGFYRPDGDRAMKVAFEEAIRAVMLRYPVWEPKQIDLSFGEKFTAHGGPSAGVAFALLALSALEGFDIDPRFAVTGDITVDWKVRKVGGVAAKIRGAALDKFHYVAIPNGNETAFADMALLHGLAALWETQVFSISTLQEAIALARVDRPTRLAQAIKLFAELQPQLNKGQRVFLRNQATQETLRRVLELAPNHLSARFLLAVADGSAAKTLSANATLYQLSVIFYPFRAALDSGNTLDRSALPAHVTALARKRLNALRPLAHKELNPLLADIGAFIEAIDGFAAGTVAGTVVMSKAQNLDSRFAALNSDPDFVARLVREGY